MNQEHGLLKALVQSEIYQKYERAFSDATGLPLALRPVEACQPPFRGKAKENRFCALMAKNSAACAACCGMQERLSREAAHGPTVLKCHFGMAEAAVPVKLGENILGILTTGQVLTQPASAAQLGRVTATMEKLGVKVDAEKAREAYQTTPVIPAPQLASMTILLDTFAEHLAARSNEIQLQQTHAEPAAVKRGKAFIQQNLAEDITLDDVAKEACVSRFYFCKIFKRYTGLNFSAYVTRLRIEWAKRLLMNPHLRVSEIAFEVGFRSLTQFNRCFRQLAGESATLFRKHRALSLAA